MDNLTLQQLNKTLEEFSGKEYYENVKKLVDLLIKSEKFNLAEELIAQELKVPYIEAEMQIYLVEKYELAASLEEKQVLTLPITEIFEMLTHDEQDTRAIAIDGMRKHNLRNHIERIRKYLDEETNLLLRNLMHEVLNEQSIVIENLKFEVPEIDYLKRDQTFSKIEDEIEKLEIDEIQKSFMKENAVIMLLNNLHNDLDIKSIINILKNTNLVLMEIETDQVELDENEKNILKNLINQL
jgi:hypothetical protein